MTFLQESSKEQHNLGRRQQNPLASQCQQERCGPGAVVQGWAPFPCSPPSRFCTPLLKDTSSEIDQCLVAVLPAAAFLAGEEGDGAVGRKGLRA